MLFRSGHQFREIRLVGPRVDECMASRREDPKSVFKPKVDARWLDRTRLEWVDKQPAQIDEFSDRPVAKNHRAPLGVLTARECRVTCADSAEPRLRAQPLPHRFAPSRSIATLCPRLPGRGNVAILRAACTRRRRRAGGV